MKFFSSRVAVLGDNLPPHKIPCKVIDVNKIKNSYNANVKTQDKLMKKHWYTLTRNMLQDDSST